jgi:hypothetical protein
MSLLSLLLAAMAVALGACGGADDRKEKNAYVREVNAAQTEFASSTTRISQRTSPAGIGAYRRTLGRFQASITAFSTTLSKISVPEAVTGEHARLVAAVTSFAKDFKAIVAVLDNPTPRSLSEAQTEIMTATQRANARIEAAAKSIDEKLGT